MIHPSYVDLMNVVNEGALEGETPVINSRYSIVMATAKRARQIVDGDEPMIEYTEGRKPLSIAVEELEQGQLKILPRDEDEVISSEEAEYAAAKAMEIGLTEEALRLAEEEKFGNVPREESDETGSDDDAKGEA